MDVLRFSRVYVMFRPSKKLGLTSPLRRPFPINSRSGPLPQKGYRSSLLRLPPSHHHHVWSHYLRPQTRIYSSSKISRNMKSADPSNGTGGGNKESKVAEALAEFEDHNPLELVENRSEWLWFSIPNVPVAGAPCAMYFNKSMSESLRHSPQIQIIRAFNEWELDNQKINLQSTILPKDDGSDWWSCDFSIPEDSYEMNFVFTDGNGNFDNNFGQDFVTAVHWGTTRDEWLDGANERAAKEMERRLAKEKLAVEEAEQNRKNQMEQNDINSAKWKIGELKGKLHSLQDGASDKLKRESGEIVWRMQSPAIAGKKAVLYYYPKASGLSHMKIPPSDKITVKMGINGWQRTRDFNMDYVIGMKDVWCTKIRVPKQAVVLNFVFLYGDVFDNNNRMDYRALVHPPPLYKSYEEWLDTLVDHVKEQERRIRLRKEHIKREQDKKKEVVRKEAMDKALEVSRRQIKHVLFTDPPTLEAGGEVTIYYCPNDTCLNGKEDLYIMGGWNRWSHKRKLGPIKMEPPREEGVHWHATVEIPYDVFIMDFVVADVPSGDGTYDNRGGYDYHMPVVGSLAKEPPLHIVHISVEMAPIAKVGGLGDVVTSLGRAVKDQGHLVEVILPRFDFLLHSPLLDNLQYECEFEWDGTHIYVTSQLVEGLKVFFIEPKNGLFGVQTVYGRSDDGMRFDFFCKAALQFLLISGRQPDILHCHDWPTAPIAKFYWEEFHHWGLWKPRVVFTIHNLNYGDVQIGEAAFYSQRFTTVSPTYAFEVGSHAAIEPNVGKFVGIRNGIDVEIWDPENDQFIPMHYNSSNLEEGKKAARRQLANRIGINSDREAPIVGVVSRLTAQKGVHLIKHAAWRVLERGGIFVLLGSAPDPKIQSEFEDLAASFGHAGSSVRFCFAFDEPLSHLIYSACDMILVPSMFEPCGLAQLIAMRYGSIPVVRHTGGLRDTVFDVDYDKDRAAWAIEGSSDWVRDEVDATNGFAFGGTDTSDLDFALNRALDAWYNDREWFRSLQKRVMEQDWSWNRPGVDYIELYHATLK